MQAFARVITFAVPSVLFGAVVVSSIISKIIYRVTGVKQFDTSKEAYIKYMKVFTDGSSYGNRLFKSKFQSLWVLKGDVHVLCRYSTVFSDEPPIFIIHDFDSCSFNYVEFMRRIPEHHDVFCIDLPGWGISESLSNVVLTSDKFHTIYQIYSDIICRTILEICPIEGTKFSLFGHSFGATLLSHVIASKMIAHRQIDRIVLYNLQERSSFISNLFIKMGFPDVLFNVWWAPHLFCAFLQKRAITPKVLGFLRRFIVNKDGHKLMLRDQSDDDLNRDNLILVNASKNVKVILVNGVYDTMVDCERAETLCKESRNSIKSHELETDHYMPARIEDFQQLFKIMRVTHSE